MTAFVDTSSLIKRYVAEKGSSRFIKILMGLTDVVIAPITIIEIYSGLFRRLKDKSLASSAFQIIENELGRNFQDYSVVVWNEDLVMDSIAMARKHALRTLDAIQLASARMAGSLQFITSDQELARVAKKEIKEVLLV